MGGSRGPGGLAGVGSGTFAGRREQPADENVDFLGMATPALAQ